MLIEYTNQLAGETGQRFCALQDGIYAPPADHRTYLVVQALDVFVLIFHQIDDRSNFLRSALEQLRPQMYVLAVVMRIQVDTKNVDVVGDNL
jgi:hypothetical protein